MTTFVIKVLQRTQLSHSQADIKPFIYVRSSWLNDEAEFDFLTTGDHQNYRGSLKFEELRKAASELEQSYDAFFAECQKAMTTHMGLQGFDYEITHESPEQQVFKMYKCEGYETLFLEVPLRKVSNCYQLLDAAIELGQQQAQVAPVATVSSEEQRLKACTLFEYEQYVKDSKLKEAEMLKKFVLLLNSKKAHIRDLKNKLEERSPMQSKQQRISDREEDEVYGAVTQAMDLENDSD
ncbi:hypothetical protein KR009_005502 [Drosophila setifemur]|nr:hypothetical protein KR009_005502 [Drosophila setifemur]